MNRSKSNSIGRGVGISAALVCAATTVSAQEAIRSGRAGENATDARNRNLEQMYYNLKAGPVLARLDAGWGLEFNSNVTLVQENPEDDVINRPSVNLNLFWPATPQNWLALDLSFGIAKYSQHSDLDYVFLTPGSELSFNFQVANVAVNIHDRIQHTQDPAGEPSLSNVGEFGRLENTVGIRADWDAGPALITFGYDHFNYISTSEIWTALDRRSELFYSKVTLVKERKDRFGIDLGGGITDYDRTILNDNDHFSAGVFWDSQLTPRVSVSSAAGYVSYRFDNTGSIQDDSDPDGLYGFVTLQHEVNRFFTHSLSGGKQLQLGYTANILDLYYARYTAQWNLIRKLGIQTPFFYEHGTESGALKEELDRFGAGIRLDYQITRGLSATGEYQFLTKDSNLPLRDYDQHRVILNLRYQF